MNEQGAFNLRRPAQGVTLGSWWRWRVPERLANDEPFEVAWRLSDRCGIRYRGTDEVIDMREADVVAAADPITSPGAARGEGGRP